ncbi:MAG TPA: hypothetical protein VI282_09450 [Verrucomicrobiae bacterium]
MKKLVTTAALLVALTLAAPSAFAITAAQAKAIKKAVTSVPVAEMPAKAAQLVTDASKEDREAVAVTAVRAGIYKSRASARLLVSAVVKAAPEVAGPVTLAASEMEVGQAGYIASAAISSAPSAKTQIVTSANRGVTLAAGGTVPTTPVRAFTPRGAAAAPATATVTQSNTPINTSTGGNGSGSFAGATATPAGNPVIVDYTGPRS